MSKIPLPTNPDLQATEESDDAQVDRRVLKVPHEYLGQRLDQAAAALFPDFSRARIQEWIKSGDLLVNGSSGKSKNKLAGGEELALTVVTEPQGDWVAEDIPLDVIYDDEQIIVINKPMGMVVHPAAGNPSGTLLNGLLHAYPELVDLPRAGIVHRLDKDTTGLLVVARTLKAHQSLVSQLQARAMGREYIAVAWGRVPAQGTIDEPIGRHLIQRQKMAVIENKTIHHPSTKHNIPDEYLERVKKNNGKEAITHYEVKRRFSHHSLVQLKLASGRTHQIRVHLTHIGHPIVGDQTYGKRQRFPKDMDVSASQAVKDFPRQALHARRLTLKHPVTDDEVSWEIPLPRDIEELLFALGE
ncbi:MAG: pseudouridine synthase [Cellvibrionaceae bacterium]